jgi:hypothetical protein
VNPSFKNAFFSLRVFSSCTAEKFLTQKSILKPIFSEIANSPGKDEAKSKRKEGIEKGKAETSEV